MPLRKSRFSRYIHLYLYSYTYMPFMDARLYFLMMCFGYKVMGCDSDAFYDLGKTECTLVEQLYVSRAHTLSN